MTYWQALGGVTLFALFITGRTPRLPRRSADSAVRPAQPAAWSAFLVHTIGGRATVLLILGSGAVTGLIVLAALLLAIP